MGSITTLLILIWLFQLVALAGNVRAWRQFRTELHRAPLRRPADISGEAGPPPDAAQPLLKELAALDFEPLGVAEAGNPALEESLPVWVFRSQHHPIHAELAEVRNRLVLGFVTLFGEQAALETFYRGSQRLRQPDLDVLPVRKSVTAAYERHLERLSTFSARYGEPLRVNSMADFVAAIAAYNQRFLPRKLAAMRPRMLIPLVTSTYSAVLLLGGLIAHLWLDPPLFTLIAALALLITPAMLVDLVLIVRRGRP